MRDVYIVAVGMTHFGKHLDRTEKDLVAEAVARTMADAPDIKISDIQSAWFSNTTWGFFKMQHAIRGQVALRPLGIEGIPITNVENACGGRFDGAARRIQGCGGRFLRMFAGCRHGEALQRG